ncbi:Uncharacterised protein [Mycobacteroides abscessus subsp. abscessus]|nr:Uncharacterised protein [Mycobacteroides abscessus subsp. abscessus]
MGGRPIPFRLCARLFGCLSTLRGLVELRSAARAQLRYLLVEFGLAARQFRNKFLGRRVRFLTLGCSFVRQGLGLTACPLRSASSLFGRRRLGQRFAADILDLRASGLQITCCPQLLDDAIHVFPGFVEQSWKAVEPLFERGPRH